MARQTCVPTREHGNEGVARIRARHTPVHPIRHGARVELPAADFEQGRLFEEK